MQSDMGRLCVGCFLSCCRYLPKLFFLSAAAALKRNTAQRENCSLTAVGSLKAFAARTHIKKTVFFLSFFLSDNAGSGSLDVKYT